MRYTILIAASALMVSLGAQQAPNPRQQPGAITAFAPEQHDLYDGRFVLSANRIYMVGTLNDPPGWDHMDNAAAMLRPASGTAEIDVDEIANTGKFEARLKIPEGDLVLAVDKWNELAVAAMLIATRRLLTSLTLLAAPNLPKYRHESAKPPTTRSAFLAASASPAR